MKISINLCLALCLVSLLAQAQTNLSSEQWKEDVRHLQTKVHQDYSNLFIKTNKEEFDSATNVLINEIPSLKDHEITVRIAELVALFGYGHTALWLTSWRYNRAVNFHQLPVNFYSFSEGIYLQGVHRDYKDLLAAKVLKIEDVEVEKVLEIIRPVVSAENDQFFKAHGIHYLGVPEVLHAKGVIQNMDEVELTVEIGGQVIKRKIKPTISSEFPGKYSLIQSNENWLESRQQPENGETPLWLKDLHRKYHYEYLPSDQVIYLRQSEVVNEDHESLADFYSKVSEFIDQNSVKRLIIDLRLNSGGNNYNNRDVLLTLIRNEKLRERGSLIVILGRRTFSAAQNFVNEIDNYTEAIFVGEPTAENINFMGDSRVEILPNSGLSVRLSFAWWQDKPQWENDQWLAPDIPVEMSFDDYWNGRDPILEAAIQLDEQDFLFDPKKYLVELFKRTNVDEIKNQLETLFENPMNANLRFENAVNLAAYEMIKLKMLSKAKIAFQFNADTYPQSANVWDSLAEIHWRMGDTNTAKTYYNKSINLDPNGPIGENSRAMLRRIEDQ